MFWALVLVGFVGDGQISTALPMESEKECHAMMRALVDDADRPAPVSVACLEMPRPVPVDMRESK